MQSRRSAGRLPAATPAIEGTPIPDSLLELRRRLGGKDPKELQDAAWELKSLVESGQDASSVIPAVPLALRASFSPEAGSLAKTYLTDALLGLARAGADIEPCLPALLGAIEDNSIQVRNNIVLILGLCRAPESAAGAVYSRLSDIAPMVRDSALEVLKGMASEDGKAAEEILRLIGQDAGPKSYHDELRTACAPKQ